AGNLKLPDSDMNLTQVVVLDKRLQTVADRQAVSAGRHSRPRIPPQSPRNPQYTKPRRGPNDDAGRLPLDPVGPRDRTPHRPRPGRRRGQPPLPPGGTSLGRRGAGVGQATSTRAPGRRQPRAVVEGGRRPPRRVGAAADDVFVRRRRGGRYRGGQDVAPGRPERVPPVRYGGIVPPSELGMTVRWLAVEGVSPADEKAGGGTSPPPSSSGTSATAAGPGTATRTTAGSPSAYASSSTASSPRSYACTTPGSRPPSPRPTTPTGPPRPCGPSRPTPGYRSSCPSSAGSSRRDSGRGGTWLGPNAHPREHVRRREEAVGRTPGGPLGTPERGRRGPRQGVPEVRDAVRHDEAEGGPVASDAGAQARQAEGDAVRGHMRPGDVRAEGRRRVPAPGGEGVLGQVGGGDGRAVEFRADAGREGGRGVEGGEDERAEHVPAGHARRDEGVPPGGLAGRAGGTGRRGVALGRLRGEAHPDAAREERLHALGALNFVDGDWEKT
ncbi:hypothetical protein THAOC_23290, partial [Thalassiosira oceanica]